MSTVSKTAGAAGSITVTTKNTAGQLIAPVSTPTVKWYTDSARTLGETSLTVSGSGSSYTASWLAGSAPASPASRYLKVTIEVSAAVFDVDADDDISFVDAVSIIDSTAFATATELGARTGTTYTGTELAQVNALLDDATAHLQGLIGQQINPGTSVAILYASPEDEWLDLPEQPVRSIASVQVGEAGSEETITDFDLVNGALYLGRAGRPAEASFGSVLGGSQYRRVVVTYTHGRLTIPADLKSWCMVLALQALTQIQTGGAIGPSGKDSERIDDYAVNFAQTAEAGAAAFRVPDHAVDQLRSRYGRSAFVTGSR